MEKIQGHGLSFQTYSKGAVLVRTVKKVSKNGADAK